MTPCPPHVRAKESRWASGRLDAAFGGPVLVAGEAAVSIRRVTGVGADVVAGATNVPVVEEVEQAKREAAAAIRLQAAQEALQQAMMFAQVAQQTALAAAAKAAAQAEAAKMAATYRTARAADEAAKREAEAARLAAEAAAWGAREFELQVARKEALVAEQAQEAQTAARAKQQAARRAASGDDADEKPKAYRGKFGLGILGL